LDPLQGFRIGKEPFYLPRGREMEIFKAAAKANLPVLLKGPTGCGKTRFLSRMAYELGRPLITVACHEDLSGPDLVGRYLFLEGETRWTDGPLTLAVRHGAICYLDEIVEGRQDSLAILHPLLDDRRMLVVEKLGRVITAHPDFLPVVSYNPGYQSALKDLKVSTAQRFAALEFDYPEPWAEAEIIVGEAGADPALAEKLVRIAQRIRLLKEVGLVEGASTRLLIYAAKLIKEGVSEAEAAQACLLTPLTDDEDLKEAISGIISDIFG
jgi:nitric oxide reductase NorQ protein